MYHWNKSIRTPWLWQGVTDMGRQQSRFLSNFDVLLGMPQRASGELERPSNLRLSFNLGIARWLSSHLFYASIKHFNLRFKSRYLGFPFCTFMLTSSNMRCSQGNERCFFKYWYNFFITITKLHFPNKNRSKVSNFSNFWFKCLFSKFQFRLSIFAQSVGSSNFSVIASAIYKG